MAFKVKSTQLGQYKQKLHHEGKIFYIDSVEEFSYSWMKSLDSKLDAALGKLTKEQQINAGKTSGRVGGGGGDVPAADGKTDSNKKSVEAADEEGNFDDGEERDITGAGEDEKEETDENDEVI